jgi:hypothetical protein
MNIVSVEPALGIFKRGDDFAFCLENNKGDTVAALHAYAEFLHGNAAVVTAIAEALKGVEATADAGTHMIRLSIPKDVAEALAGKDLVHIDDEEEWECDDEDCDDSDEDDSDDADECLGCGGCPEADGDDSDNP